VRVLERLVPGETKIVTVPIPQPYAVPGGDVIRQVPVEVTKVVREPGDTRVVTVTTPVEVPVEVVRERWPQTITVHVGGVLSGGQWYTPDYPDLVLGQVTPGVYVVPNQPGWRVDAVATETKLDAPPPSTQPLPHLLIFPVSVTASADGVAVGPRLQYQNRAWGGVYQVAVSYVGGQGQPHWRVDVGWGIGW
jgi:hypothetical protein